MNNAFELRSDIFKFALADGEDNFDEVSQNDNFTNANFNTGPVLSVPKHEDSSQQHVKKSRWKSEVLSRIKRAGATIVPMRLRGKGRIPNAESQIDEVVCLHLPNEPKPLSSSESNTQVQTKIPTIPTLPTEIARKIPSSKMQDVEVILNLTALCHLLPGMQFDDKLWDGDVLVAFQVDDGPVVDLESAGKGSDRAQVPPVLKILRSALKKHPQSLHLHFGIRPPEKELLDMIDELYENVMDTDEIEDFIRCELESRALIPTLPQNWCSSTAVTTADKFFSASAKLYDLRGYLIRGNPPDENSSHAQLFQWLQGALLRAEKFSTSGERPNQRSRLDMKYFNACAKLLGNPRLWRSGSKLSYLDKFPQYEVEADWVSLQLLARWRIRWLSINADRKLVTIKRFKRLRVLCNPPNGAPSAETLRHSQLLPFEDKHTGHLPIPEKWISAAVHGYLRYAMLLSWAAHAMRQTFTRDLEKLAAVSRAKVLLDSHDFQIHGSVVDSVHVDLLDWRRYKDVPSSEAQGFFNLASTNKDVFRSTLLFSSAKALLSCFESLKSGETFGTILHVSNLFATIQQDLDKLDRKKVYLPNKKMPRCITVYLRYAPEGLLWEHVARDRSTQAWKKSMEDNPRLDWDRADLGDALSSTLRHVRNETFSGSPAGLVLTLHLMLKSSTATEQSLRIWRMIGSSTNPLNLAT